MSFCDVTFCSSVAREQFQLHVSEDGQKRKTDEQRTVQSDWDAFRQDIAVRANENRHLSQRIYLEKLLVVFLVIFIGIDDVQLEAMRFCDG